MKRLTDKDSQGNWQLKGVEWEQLHAGQVITKDIWEKLYGALWKLMEYENTGLTPEEIVEINDFEKSQISHLMKELVKEREKHQWISTEYEVPPTSDYVLLSFANFSIPLVGRYEQDETGGAWYLGDCDEDDTCVANDLYVNAWMPLPTSYEGE